ncbi:THAP domain-containing protein 1-like [Harmonia axyridis]|uniref:THAP domain-containing protein 1-like n=1 Tax=Harmonia axyridis TaxID=115357 RepID=UPI001E2779CE|nr:THAP domain-containing protein 1-like [Harmonia axyridis]
MVSCAACGYSITPTNKNSGVTFHSFPKDENRRLKWISFVKKPGFIPNKRSLLCSRHFRDDCFERSYKASVRLIPNASPTIVVNRHRWVRSFNQEEIIHDSTTESTSEIKFSSPPKISISEEKRLTPREKRTISYLKKVNELQRNKIRTMQKTIWQQENEISSLKTKMMDLKNENLLLEEHCDVMLDHFENNKASF